MATTELEMLKRMERMEGLLEKAAKPSSSVGKAGALFGGYQGGGGRSDGPWNRDGELMTRLAKAYNSDNAVHFMSKNRNSKPRGIGWGPALAKMAAIANPNVASIGDYGQENLEREFGFCTVGKAASVGVKGLNGEVRKTALAEGSGQTGGYVVPPQFLMELLTIAAEDAFIEPRAKVIPMTSRTVTWPMLDITTAQATGTSPYFGGILASWQPEAATINETEPQFKQSEWTAWDLVLYTVSSNQLLADNGIGLDALLTQLFAQAITWYKEYAFLNGRGAGNSMPLGVLNAPATYVQSRTTGSLFKLSDAAAMMSRLHVQSWDDACWIMHQSVIPQLIQMNDAGTIGTAGAHLVWVNNPQNPGTTTGGGGQAGPMASKLPQAFLNGLPIFFTEKVPTLGTKGDVMLVDWSRYVIGNRLDFQIDVSPHFLFRNNQLAWRVVARCDGKPWLNGPITDANGWVSSPFVVLNT